MITSHTPLVGQQVAIAQRLAAFPDVIAVAPVGSSADRSVLAFQVLPADGPSSVSTEALVRSLRGASPLDGGVTIGVAGGFILSYFATLGGVVAIYQWGWFGGLFGGATPAPILNFLPTILVGVLFGLAMDYMLFLATGMREAYVHGAASRTAVVLGLRAGRAVVAAAAIIMISVFGAFVLSDSAIIRPIGFALALGVLLDAFVVRLVITPALMTLAGDSAWWLPRWLDRILPNVDVEGAALERRHSDHLATAPVAPADGA